MANIVLAGLLGLAFSTLQLLLMRRVLHLRAGAARGLLLLLKVPLWAVAFIAIALWWGTGPLLAFGLSAGGTYLSVAIITYIRSRAKHRKEG